MTFTAAQIAKALRVAPQAIRQRLAGVAPSGTQTIKGRAAVAWTLDQLPAALAAELEAGRARTGCRTIEDYIIMASDAWQPDLPMDQIRDADLQDAIQNREIFQPVLERLQQPGVTAAELEQTGLRDYHHVNRVKISASYFRKLLHRFQDRAGADPDFDNLTLYLPARPLPKETPPDPVPPALAAKFERLEYFIRKRITNPVAPDKAQYAGLWKLALECHERRVSAGEAAETVTAELLQFLSARAKFLAPNPAALEKTFARRQAKGIQDGRKRNGNRAKYTDADLKRLRHSAFDKNGGRIDAAWRQEYDHLSEYTRKRHPRTWKCPRRLKKAVNKALVNMLQKAATSDKALRDACGHLTLDRSNDQSMSRWYVDDMTSNLQCSFLGSDNQLSLILPQIIAVIDDASGKIVGCAISNDQGPTSRLVCAAVKDALRKHGIPREIGLENGWVFGRALNINGKEDQYGEQTVYGLSRYGCLVRHFRKRSPTSKGRLENAFNLLQQRMEGDPGWGGRNQRLDASDDFKREERFIRDNPDEAKKHRYTFEQLCRRLDDIMDDYNSTPQPYGSLKGMSPNEAFDKWMGPIKPQPLNNELEWLLSEQYRVVIQSGITTFPHYGREVQVNGGELPKHIGETWLALMQLNDDSMATFISQDHTEVFTVETLPTPHPDETRIYTNSKRVAAGLQQINSHARAFKDLVKESRREFGNTRQNLLAQMQQREAAEQAETIQRRIVVDPVLAHAGETMKQQREDIAQQRRQRIIKQRQADAIAERTGLNFSPEALAELSPEDRQEFINRLSKKNA